MSLDITVKPHYKDYVLNKNHKITHDEFEEMVSPDKGDFAYVIHPKQLAKDKKKIMTILKNGLVSKKITYQVFT